MSKQLKIALALMIGLAAGAIFTAIFCIALFVIPFLQSFYDPLDRNDPIAKVPPFIRPPQDDGDQRFGFIDTNGKMVIEPKYEKARAFHEGLCAVKVDGKWGYIDKQGKLVIPANYDAADDFAEGLAAAQSSGEWGFINNTGQWVIRPAWRAVSKFKNGIAFVGEGHTVWQENPVAPFNRSEIAVIDKMGRELLPKKTRKIDQEQNGLFKLEESGRVGYLDDHGKVVIQPQFNGGTRFSDGLAAVQTAGNWGYIDATGKMIIPAQFDAASEFHGGAAAVMKSGKYYMIDRNGRPLINPQPQPIATMYLVSVSSRPASYISEGLLPIGFNKHWGFMDCATAKVVIPPAYSEVDTFSEHLAKVGVIPTH